MARVFALVPLVLASENCTNDAPATDNVMLQTRSAMAASVGMVDANEYSQIHIPLDYDGVEACTPENPCPPCKGDCDSDDDCAGGGKCFQRSGHEQVPGCDTGGDSDMVAIDYCYKPLEDLGGSGCTASNPCGLCEGDCDSDADCADGLSCFQRDGQAQVPYCGGGGDGDHSNYDFCTIAPAGPSSWHPGSSGPAPAPAPVAHPSGGGGSGPCIPQHSIPPDCTPCRDNNQCADPGFCCPVMKRCVVAGQGCGGPSGGCNPRCYWEPCTTCHPSDGRPWNDWQRVTCGLEHFR